MAYVSTVTLPNEVSSAINKKVEFAFQPKRIFAQVAESKVHENGIDAQPGSPVYFTIYDTMNPATDELSETADPTAVSVSSSQKSVTLKEHGNLTTTTEKLERLSSLGGVRESTIPTLIGGNMGESVDILARKAMDAQTGTDYVTYVGQTAKTSITGSNVLTASGVRNTRLKLERENVPVDPRFGAYLFVAHPDVLLDLRTETGDAAWVSIAKYADPAAALKGEIGMFDGFRFLSTTNVLYEPNGGAASQAATTVDGAHSAGDTTVDVASATGIVAGDSVSITVGSDVYSYSVTSVSSNTLTLGRCFNLNGNPYRASAAGLVVAAAGGEAVKEGVDVYTSYAMGYQAMAYGYAQNPVMTREKQAGGLGRFLDIGWYGLFGYGALRDNALHKVFSGSSVGNNA